ncbi:metal ABC transporter ATP-binding protein [Streptomyces hygroscopicus]|uniref:Zinc transport system ATP-binding protein n=1 Tax=Streptomyces demainii TaxID=588122 RepID=A0ABT9KP61_9ACTN|nr:MULTISPECIES: metal ABC transporter ATP-binding protein [Streptomyces]MDP9610201.1 zinc transport system ATP-binding protein [Streptomyces demainii]
METEKTRGAGQARDPGETEEPDIAPAPAPAPSTNPAAAPSAGPAAGPAPAADPAADPISLRGATATLGGRPVLRGVDLTVRRGEVVALLGANGSGKSTAVRSIVGQVPLTGGELTLFGIPRRRFRDWARIGYVPQRTTAASGVPATVREVVSAGRLARRRFGPPRRADRAAVQRALELVGMADRVRDPVSALSGGQHQRVLIARALAGEPELLIMDEPMAGVDLVSQEILAGTLREQVAAGATVLLVLHELGPLEPLIDRAVVLRDGCVVHDGPPPKAVGQHALPGHDHVHPHAAPDAEPIRTGLLT